MEHTSPSASPTRGHQKRMNMDLDRYPLVLVTRTFRAPVRRVWEAWSTPELIQQWWGPVGFTCPEAKADFREGGMYNFAMRGPDGKVMWSGGEFQELDEHHKLVMTDHFTDPNGNRKDAKDYGMPGDWPEESLITVTFEKLGETATLMQIEHQGIPAQMHDDCVSGWSSSIDKLQRLVERD